MLILSILDAVSYSDLPTRTFFLYVLASYLNKVGVSFLWVGYDLSLHAGSGDCPCFYKHLSDKQ